MMKALPHELLSSGEAATLLGLSGPGFLAKVRNGTLPPPWKEARYGSLWHIRDLRPLFDADAVVARHNELIALMEDA